MGVVDDPRRQAVRFAAAVIGTAIVWLTVLAFNRVNPVDLTVALLVVLAEVLVVAVLSGPVLAVLVALVAAVLVNWYLVPPYGTFAIDSADNVAALIVFTLVAAVAATLVEVGGRARERARESTRQAELLGDIVVGTEGENAATALERVREGLGLEQVELIGRAGEQEERVLASSGRISAAPVVLDVGLADGYRMVGRGPELFAPDPDFLTSLGSAAVRAFESQRLQEESLRADELEAVDRARTALLASVGHDLRTPLTGLRVSIETLQALDASLEPDDRAALMDTIESSVERLDELITNLLDMSRLQAGALIAHPEATNVVDVIDQVAVSLADDRVHVQRGRGAAIGERGPRPARAHGCEPRVERPAVLAGRRAGHRRGAPRGRGRRGRGDRPRAGHPGRAQCRGVPALPSRGCPARWRDRSRTRDRQGLR